MKKIVLGLLAATALLASVATAAEAKVRVNVYLGVPYYDYQVGPDYVFDQDHGWYRPDSQPAYHGGNGRPQLACLVTFFRRDQVNAGADATVQRAELLPLRIAQRYDRPNDRRRIFVYGSNRKTRETCRYLAGLNNVPQGNNPNPGGTDELVCLVTFFQRDQVSGGADADVERAQALPRSIAEQHDRPDDRNRIFVYGGNQKTRETCNYLDHINN